MIFWEKSIIDQNPEGRELCFELRKGKKRCGSGSGLDPDSVGPRDREPGPDSQYWSGPKRAKRPTKIEKS